MTRLSYFLSVTIVLLVLSQFFMAYQSNKIETPKYTVLKSYDDFELRQYGSMILAQTVMQSVSYENTSSQGFRTVASYIFGGNEENKKIAMTAPVIMEMGDDTKMSFVMPKEHSIESLPEPSSEEVKILKVSPKKYAVITFPGYANNKKIDKYAKKLLKSIKSEGLQTVGNVKFMGYNAPWQVIGRKNEIAVEVK
ncbi:MAG: heme-binding protein [Flavobacteriales bacterium]|nr:MAG: heme-binding protein [Flavobacteriales bacterium]